MNYRHKLKKHQSDLKWDDYCAFLNLSLEEFTLIQNRLLKEQLLLWNNSPIGQHFLKGENPKTLAEFRSAVPLTCYDDYADFLLNRQEHLLPEPPVTWIETTWEGGKHPIKAAPYTQAMLNTFEHNLLAIASIASCDNLDTKRVRLRRHDRALFGLAPLPYVTGLFPPLLENKLNFRFLPPVREANAMGFGERNKKGFAMGLEQGIDIFFGLTSVVHYMTETFINQAAQPKGSHQYSLKKISPKMCWRFLQAKRHCQEEKRPLMPKDLFRLKAFLCSGTDSALYKDRLEETWGIRPHEAFAGTECALVATETGSQSGMVFFPDANFYEFIPETEYHKNRLDPNYTPTTCLFSELEEGQNFELVITSLKGGVFARYRTGDMFRCLHKYGDKMTKLPLLQYVDRVPTTIDIASFTRITERSIREVIDLSGQPIKDWFVKKEYSRDQKPFMHLYAEIDVSALDYTAVCEELLTDQLKACFKYFDADYDDLEKMLGIAPLQLTLLKSGALNDYYQATGNQLLPMNPSTHDINTFMDWIAQTNTKKGPVIS